METNRIGIAIALMLVGPFMVQAAADPQSRFWTFDTDAHGTLPKQFVIGALFDGRPAGEWKVLQDSGAPSSPNIFSQMFGKGQYMPIRSS
jgi:hypothetical protein